MHACVHVCVLVRAVAAGRGNLVLTSLPLKKSRIYPNTPPRLLPLLSGLAAATASGDISIATMKKFITFARNKCAPRLSPDAAQALATAYVTIRKDSRTTESQAREARIAGEE